MRISTRMDAENHIPLCSKKPGLSEYARIWGENVDFTPVAMTTESEYAPIINTFWQRAR